MRQLVELQKEAERFAKLDTEVVLVYREEQAGIAGLKKIKSKSKTTFTLGLDLNKQSSHRYSSQKSAFHNYVIDRSGVVRKIIDGTKVRRATSKQLLNALAEIGEAQPSP